MQLDRLLSGKFDVSGSPKAKNAKRKLAVLGISCDALVDKHEQYLDTFATKVLEHIIGSQDPKKFIEHPNTTKEQHQDIVLLTKFLLTPQVLGYETKVQTQALNSSIAHLKLNYSKTLFPIHVNNLTPDTKLAIRQLKSTQSFLQTAIEERKQHQKDPLEQKIEHYYLFTATEQLLAPDFQTNEFRRIIDRMSAIDFSTDALNRGEFLKINALLARGHVPSSEYDVQLGKQFTKGLKNLVKSPSIGISQYLKQFHDEHIVIGEKQYPLLDFIAQNHSSIPKVITRVIEDLEIRFQPEINRQLGLYFNLLDELKPVIHYAREHQDQKTMGLFAKFLEPTPLPNLTLVTELNKQWERKRDHDELMNPEYLSNPNGQLVKKNHIRDCIHAHSVGIEKTMDLFSDASADAFVKSFGKKNRFEFDIDYELVYFINSDLSGENEFETVYWEKDVEPTIKKVQQALFEHGSAYAYIEEKAQEIQTKLAQKGFVIRNKEQKVLETQGLLPTSGMKNYNALLAEIEKTTINTTIGERKQKHPELEKSMWLSHDGMKVSDILGTIFRMTKAMIGTPKEMTITAEGVKLKEDYLQKRDQSITEALDLARMLIPEDHSLHKKVIEIQNQQNIKETPIQYPITWSMTKKPQILLGSAEMHCCNFYSITGGGDKRPQVSMGLLSPAEIYISGKMDELGDVARVFGYAAVDSETNEPIYLVNVPAGNEAMFSLTNINEEILKATLAATYVMDAKAAYFSVLHPGSTPKIARKFSKEGGYLSQLGYKPELRTIELVDKDFKYAKSVFGDHVEPFIMGYSHLIKDYQRDWRNACKTPSKENGPVNVFRIPVETLFDFEPNYNRDEMVFGFNPFAGYF